MIFRRRKKDEVSAGADGSADEPVGETVEGDREAPDGEAEEPAEASEAGDPELDLDALDDQDWRVEGPWDITETDLDLDPEQDHPRIDLGSIVVTGYPGAELRLQMSEETQQIVSAMLISGESAIELGAFAAPRTGGYWRELRDELAEAATEAGGSVAFIEGPFGVELDRLLPVTTPDGQQGYQPSRMWVAEGPRWMLRGIVYGAAALPDAPASALDPLADAFRQVIVRRDEQAMAPGDLLPLSLPQDLQPVEPD